jgi:RNA polymerase sigma-70 factor (ECF subfamily)
MSHEEPTEGSGSGARPTPLTSLSLLERARGQDQQAWERLFYLYRPLVLFWCSRWGVHQADADDVSQEVFRAASAGLGTFRHDRPGDTFRGWLRGITHNRVLMHFRARQHQLQATGGSDAQARLEATPDPAAETSADDPAEQVSALYRRALDLVRAEFEDRTWQMFWQTVVENRTTAAVAADLGVTVAAVRKARSRVLHRLKEEVGDLIV